MSNHKTIIIRVSAKQYENDDDCLAAAETDVQAAYDLAGWDLCPRWADEQRDAILLDLPCLKADTEGERESEMGEAEYRD